MSEGKNKMDLKVNRQSESVTYIVKFPDRREYVAHYQFDHNVGYGEWDVYDDNGDEIRGPLRDRIIKAASELEEHEENL